MITSMNDQQVQIRVKLNSQDADPKKTAEKSALTEQQTGYTYHYFRIFGVATLASCVVWGGYQYFTDAPEPPDAENIAMATVNQLTQQAPPAAINSSLEISAETTDAEQEQKEQLARQLALSASTVEKSLLPPEQSSALQSQQAELIKSATTDADQSVSDSSVTDSSVTTINQTANAKPVKVNAHRSEQKKATITPKQLASAGSLKKRLQVRADSVTTTSASVKRAKLTKAIKGNEPVGDANKVQAGENGIAKLVLFTELHGLKDEFITHTWIHEGKVESKIKIGVWSNRYRCYSSKYLTKNKTGKWQVKVEDSKGNQLAMGEFNYGL